MTAYHARERSREDRRLQLVSIRGTGRAVVDEIDRMGEQLGTALRAGGTREERAQLVSILERLRDDLRKLDQRGA